MTTHVIINPASRGGRTGRHLERLVDRMRAGLGAFELRLTTGPGHATRHARQALALGARRIIAVGGDGTVSEVVNGFFEHGEALNPEAELGLIALGSGGDFARSIGLPRGIEGQLAVLQRGYCERLDLGTVDFTGDDGARHRRLFANVAGFGLSARVAEAVNTAKFPKRLGGPFAHALPALRALISHRNAGLRLTLNERECWESTCALVIAANGRYCGGGLMAAPLAELADGSLDIIVFGDIGPWDGLRNLRRLYRGRHLTHPKISSRRAHALTAEAIDPEAVVDIEADGERLGRLPARIGVVPRAIKVVVGNGWFPNAPNMRSMRGHPQQDRCHHGPR